MNNEQTNTTPITHEDAPALVKKLGNTTYEVSFHFSTTSKETMDDKIKRLIKRDMSA